MGQVKDAMCSTSRYWGGRDSPTTAEEDVAWEASCKEKRLVHNIARLSRMEGGVEGNIRKEAFVVQKDVASRLEKSEDHSALPKALHAQIMKDAELAEWRCSQAEEGAKIVDEKKIALEKKKEAIKVRKAAAALKKKVTTYVEEGKEFAKKANLPAPAKVTTIKKTITKKNTTRKTTAWESTKMTSGVSDLEDSLDYQINLQMKKFSPEFCNHLISLLKKQNAQVKKQSAQELVEEKKN